MLTTSLIQLRQRNYKSREKNDAAIPFVIERLYFKQLDAYLTLPIMSPCPSVPLSSLIIAFKQKVILRRNYL